MSALIYDAKLEKERVASLRAAHAAVALVPPHVKKGEYPNQPIRAWAARVWEEAAPRTGRTSSGSCSASIR